jgi:hypothetical protein
MERSILYIIIIQAILFSSCKKENVNYTLDDFIQAGQKNGAGIEYTDLDPDIHCTIIDPWEKTDTIINLDINKDGIDDFTIKGSMCHPSMLGGDCENLSITPLLNNAICINPITNWMDTIPHYQTINEESNWSHDEALIYSYFWIMGGNSSTEGHWKDVSVDSKYFIGFKIIKNNKTFFGWIGMKRDITAWTFNFLLTDYAILKE